MGKRRGVYGFLVGKPEGKRPFGRPSHRWEDNIKMDLQEVGWGAWTELIWLRTDRWRAFVNRVTNLLFPQIDYDRSKTAGEFGIFQLFG
jgi:hypothetical protein